jgi:hypothetical protein
MQPDTAAYNHALSATDRAICDLLATEIDHYLSGAENKIWHAHPVWFLEGNPIVGYSKQKPGIRLMFWSGADFDEAGLNVLGKKFKDASVFYSAITDIKKAVLRRWLKKARDIQWDYKNIVKRKGRLERIKSKASSSNVVPLSGGNPQIPLGYGDAPVQQYIAAMPTWKRRVGEQLDRLIVEAMPDVKKAVKWNSPFYGIEKGNWFLGFHCLTKYVKVAFFRGASLTPIPPGKSKQADVRYLDIFENDELDEEVFIDWVRQASRLPGERM